jgi:hypothetical protein
VEPPLIRWLPELPGGKTEHDRILGQLITPAAAAFRAGEREQALRVTMDFLRIPQEAVGTLRLNLREWEAITTSTSSRKCVQRKSEHTCWGTSGCARQDCPPNNSRPQTLLLASTDAEDVRRSNSREQ